MTFKEYHYINTFLIDKDENITKNTQYAELKDKLITSLSDLNKVHNISETNNGKVDTMKPIWESMVLFVVDEKKKGRIN